jgi:hypothetical protein
MQHGILMLRLRFHLICNNVQLQSNRKWIKSVTINGQKQKYRCPDTFFCRSYFPGLIVKGQLDESNSNYNEYLQPTQERKVGATERKKQRMSSWKTQQLEQEFLRDKYLKPQVLLASDDNSSRFEELSQQTMPYIADYHLRKENEEMDERSVDVKMLEELISKWFENARISNQNSEQIEILEELYKIWLNKLKQSRLNGTQYESITIFGSYSIFTSKPFDKMLQLYAYSKPNQGRQAFEVFKDWLEYFGGDLDHAPIKPNYDCLLQAYAFVCLPDNDAVVNDSNRITKLQLMIWEGYQVAMKIPPYLDQMISARPVDTRTYQLVIRNVTNAITLIPHIVESATIPANDKRSSLQLSAKDLEFVLKKYCTEKEKLEQVEGISDYFKSGGRNKRKNEESFVTLAEVVYDCSRAYMTVPLPHPAEWQFLFRVWSERIADVNLEPLELDALAESLMKYRYTGTSTSGKIILQTFLQMQTTSVLEFYKKQLAISKKDTDATKSLLLSLSNYTLGLRSHITCYDDAMIVPNTQTYTNVLYILRRWRNQNGFDESLKKCSTNLFVDVEKVFRLEYMSLNSEKRTDCANHFLMACVHTSMHCSAFTCWNKMILDGVPRNSISYNCILQVLAEGPQVVTLKQARKAHSIWETLILETVDNSTDTSLPVQLNSMHYESVMSAWSRCNHHSAGTICLEIFKKMQKHASDHPELQLVPTERHYTTLIRALERSSEPYRIKEVLDDYMTQIRRKDTAFSIPVGKMMLRSFATCSKTILDATNCEDLLDKMLKESSSSAELDVSCFTSVLNAWVQSKAVNAPEKCDFVYHKLLQAYELSNCDPRLLPNTNTYCSMIEALSNANRRTDINVGEKSMQILDEMEERWKRRKAYTPSSKVYAAVMTTLCKQNDANAVDAVENLLSRIEEGYKNGNLRARPDQRTMSAAIKMWARSNRPQQASKASNILYQMITMYNNGELSMKPSSAEFTDTLKACALTESTDPVIKTEAVRIALDISLKLDSGVYCQHNKLTFKYLFQTVCYQTDDDEKRNHYAKILFERCCQMGYVSENIIGVVRRKAPKVYRELPFDTRGNLNLPVYWMQGTKPEKH